MLAQRLYKETTQVVRRPVKRKSPLRGLIRNNMICAIMCAAVVTLVLSVYVSAYAGAFVSGCDKSSMLAELKAVRTQNNAMQQTLDQLRQPERIEAFAAENGMEQAGSRIAYIKPVGQPSVAQNPDGPNVR